MTLLFFLKPNYPDLSDPWPVSGGSKKKKKKRPLEEILKLLPNDTLEKLRLEKDALLRHVVEQELTAKQVQEQVVREYVARLEREKIIREEEEDVLAVFLMEEL